MIPREFLTLIFISIACCGCDSQTNDADNTVSETNKSSITENKNSETTGSTSPEFDQKQYVSFSATGVKLVQPEGFENAKNFHGFQQESTQSSVMVIQIPGPFSKLSGGFTAERLKTRGIILESKEDVEIDNKSALLLGVTQTARGTEFSKWILAFGDDKVTKMVTATFPKSETTKLSAILKSVVLSAQVDTTTSPTPSDDVNFTIVASAKLKPTRGVGKMLVYTRDGVIPMKSPQDPLFIAAPSLSKIQPQDKEQFALQRLKNTANTNIKKITATNEVNIDGLNGYEHVADAEDKKTGNPLAIYQVILFDEDAYILIQGMVGTKDSTEFLPEFKIMAHSLKQKKK